MRSQRVKTMNYTLVGLVVILVITITQYVMVRKQFAAYRGKVAVQETERSNVVNQLKGQLEPLKAQFETCKSQRQSEAEIAKKQVNDLQGQVNQLKTDLDARTKEKEALAGAQGEKDALAQEKTALEEKVKNLEAGVAKLTEDVKVAEAKAAEAEKKANEAKAEADKKAAEGAKKTLAFGGSGNINQTQDLVQSPVNQPTLLVAEDEEKSMEYTDKLADQRKEQLDNEVPNPKGSLDPQAKPNSASVQPHLKFEDGGGIVKSLQEAHADHTKEQLDKEEVKSLKEKPGRIVLDQKEREMAQLPDVDPNAIEIKSIDKIGNTYHKDSEGHFLPIIVPGRPDDYRPPAKLSVMNMIQNDKAQN